MDPASTSAPSSPAWLPGRAELPGLALSIALGLSALALTHAFPPTPFASDVVLAMVLGALVVNTPLRSLVGVAAPGDAVPNRAGAGVQFTGKWVLRLGIILMGLKVQTRLFGSLELLLIAGVAAATLPSTFMLTHALARALGLRRPLADLLAGGTMICGASAVNALAPIAGAEREEQGIAVGVVFAFSVVAMFAFHPLAHLIGLPAPLAGLWSGLAVNDLSSAVAVGEQMGPLGGVMAAASKSVRVLLLAPTLIAMSILRRRGSASGESLRAQLPLFVLGYVALAVLRFVGDRMWGTSATWTAVLSADRWLVDVVMATVSAAIGLHIVARSLLVGGARALAVGGGASLLIALVSLSMIKLASGGAGSIAAIVGAVAIGLSYAAYRASEPRAA